MKDVISTVGTFDGLHRGHRAVLEALVGEADRRGVTPLIVSFTNHPLDVVAPERAPAMLMTEQEKRCAFDCLGIEYRLFTFDRDLCSLTAEKWISRLRDTLGVTSIMLGYDNTFGCDGRHLTHDDYLDIGRKTGIDIIDAPVVDGVSSSAVRHALADGDIAAVTAMLGRPYTLKGEVVHGKALGRQLGFPTANISVPSRKALPRRGVYAVTVDGLPDGLPRPAVLNIGCRPTVDDSCPAVSVECHIPGWSGDLYGHDISLKIDRRLRDEQRFPSLDALKAAVNADIDALSTPLR